MLRAYCQYRRARRCSVNSFRACLPSVWRSIELYFPACRHYAAIRCLKPEHLLNKGVPDDTESMRDLFVGIADRRRPTDFLNTSSLLMLFECGTTL